MRLKYKRTIKSFVFSLLSLYCLEALCAEPLKVRADNSHNQVFIRDALKLALSKLPDTYVWSDIVTSGHLTEPRHIRLVKEGRLDIFWQTTSIELEEELQPIRIPIYRGLMGYRLLVIHKNAQFKFDRVHHIDDLKGVRFGQGKHWPDTKVLQANGFKVVTAQLFLDLYPMLRFHRFEAFPRGLHQVWHELSWFSTFKPKNKTYSKTQASGLAVEEGLLLKYVNPMYFFVSRNKPDLAQNIEKGLRLAIADGSYQRLFFSDTAIRDAIIKSNLKNRTVIHLENPLLPPETPVGEHILWFDPESDIPEVNKPKTIVE